MARTHAALLAAFALSACGQPIPSPISPEETARTAPDSPAVAYPKGPFGYAMGSVIANLQFVGQDDTNGNGVIDKGDAFRDVRLSDYYQKQGIKALFVGVAAGWCEPCKQEQPGLVQLHTKYAGKIAFLEALIENKDHNPADQDFVDQWAGTYKLPFTMVSDPTVVLGPYYAQEAFPMQLVINTADMSIVYQGNGTGDVVTEFSQIFDAIN